ncbi:MAG: rRNA pseudouridine synthase [Candidatus Abawacabacteria bacterium]|nr:rRNA pseudouridine synthase [Candidatus Abawacabacteria bacterium]
MVKSVRLQKYIADCGICSRRKAEELIRAGKVTINDKIASLGNKVSPHDQVMISGKLISATVHKVTYLIYKPIGYTSSTQDRFAERLVTDLVPKSSDRLYPVGRLDKESEGLMLLTNDGDLAYQVTHPKFFLTKIYEINITPNFRPEDQNKLKRGMRDQKEFLQLDKLEVLSPIQLRISLHHGKKRHIRRMLRKCGYEVVKLVRTNIGPLSLADLAGKSYRPLKPLELATLHPSHPNP